MMPTVFLLSMFTACDVLTSLLHRVNQEINNNNVSDINPSPGKQ